MSPNAPRDPKKSRHRIKMTVAGHTLDFAGTVEGGEEYLRRWHMLVAMALRPGAPAPDSAVSGERRDG